MYGISFLGQLQLDVFALVIDLLKLRGELFDLGFDFGYVGLFWDRGGRSGTPAYGVSMSVGWIGHGEGNYKFEKGWLRFFVFGSLIFFAKPARPRLIL